MFQIVFRSRQFFAALRVEINCLMEKVSSKEIKWRPRQVKGVSEK